MSALNKRVDDYLTVRRALGFKLSQYGRYLADFVTFVERSGSTFITTELAAAWANAPNRPPGQVAQRLAVVRRFAEFVHAHDARTEVPPREIAPHSAKKRRIPCVYTSEDIEALIDSTQELRSPFRRSTFATFFGLLATTGMRVGEVRGLDRSDFDRRDGVITIRVAKFGKSRQIPLHPTTRAALLRYERTRDRAFPKAQDPSLLLSLAGKRLIIQNIARVFERARCLTGLSDRVPRPTMHDLRHTFAIRTFIDWYRAGVDVEARLPLLSTYLGHVGPSSTYWYLTAVPELVTLAAKRLERSIGRRS